MATASLFCGVFVCFTRAFRGFSIKQGFHLSLWDFNIYRTLGTHQVRSPMDFPFFFGQFLHFAAELRQEVPRDDRLGAGSGDKGSQSQVRERALGLSPGAETSRAEGWRFVCVVVGSEDLEGED